MHGNSRRLTELMCAKRWILSHNRVTFSRLLKAGSLPCKPWTLPHSFLNECKTRQMTLLHISIFILPLTTVSSSQAAKPKA